jgi:hypothetical protein
MLPFVVRIDMVADIEPALRRDVAENSLATNRDDGWLSNQTKSYSTRDDFLESRIAAASTVKFLLDRVTKLCRNKARKPTQLKGYLCSGL